MRRLPLHVSLEVDTETIYEKGGPVDVTVTAKLDGKAFPDPTVVVFVVGSEDGAATRDLDYDAFLPSLTIDGGEFSGTKTIIIEPKDDDIAEADGETITLMALGTLADGTGGELRQADRKTKVADVTVTAAPAIKLVDGADPDAPVVTEPEPEPALSFSEEDRALAEDPIEGKVGDELTVVLPEAVVGPTEDDEDPAVVGYSLIGDLPDGLEFDAATRTISGTPEAATAEDESIAVLYDASDGMNPSVRLKYIITIAAADPELIPEPPPEPDLSFSEEAVAAAAEGISGVVGMELSVVLPEAMGPMAADAEDDGEENGEEDGRGGGREVPPLR